MAEVPLAIVLTVRSLLRRRFRPGRSSAPARVAAGPFDRQRAAARLDVDPRRRAGRGGCRRRPPRRRRCRRPASRRRRARSTRSRMRSRATTCMKPALTPLREARVRARSAGRAIATGAASTSATICTACGLPIDSTATSTRAAVAERRAATARSRAIARAARGQVGVERHARRVEDRRAHVDRDAAVVLQAQLERRVHRSRRAIVRLVGQAACRARSARSSARRCRTARPRRRCRR